MIVLFPSICISFAGNLVVGVWVGRDDDKSLGKVSGGTVPARIWRNFMTSAVAIDGSRGPELPANFRRQALPDRRDRQSPLPPEWSDGTKRLRELVKSFEDLVSSR